MALIEVRESFGNPSNAFRPVPIALPHGEVPAVGATCYVAGYGSANYGVAPLQKLMEVNFVGRVNPWARLFDKRVQKSIKALFPKI